MAMAIAVRSLIDDGYSRERVAEAIGCSTYALDLFIRAFP
jgi:hypothetical protein